MLFLPDALKPYAKLVAALAGAVVAIVGRHRGVESAVYFDVVALATALGVYATPNTDAEPDDAGQSVLVVAVVAAVVCFVLLLALGVVEVR